MVVDGEKTAFQKIVTEWIFGQSVGIVISLFTISIMLYFINQQNERIKELDNRLTDELKYQRNELKISLDNNTRALENFNLKR